jgi:hypothetical protein
MCLLLRLQPARKFIRGAFAIDVRLEGVGVGSIVVYRSEKWRGWIGGLVCWWVRQGGGPVWGKDILCLALQSRHFLTIVLPACSLIIVSFLAEVWPFVFVGGSIGSERLEFGEDRAKGHKRATDPESRHRWEFDMASGTLVALAKSISLRVAIL